MSHFKRLRSHPRPEQVAVGEPRPTPMISLGSSEGRAAAMMPPFEQQHDQQQQLSRPSGLNICSGSASSGNVGGNVRRPLSALVRTMTRPETCSPVCLLNKDKISIGRLITCDYSVSSLEVSRQHAEIVWKSDSWWIYDQSTNGVYVNNVKCDVPTKLVDGACISFGMQLQAIYKFTFVEDYPNYLRKLTRSSNIDARLSLESIGMATTPTEDMLAMQDMSTQMTRSCQQSGYNNEEELKQLNEKVKQLESYKELYEDLKSKLPANPTDPDYAKRKELLEDLTCTVCTGFFHDPVSLNCGHVFCFFCIEEWIRNRTWDSNRTTCPMCRTRIVSKSETPLMAKLTEYYLQQLLNEEQMKEWKEETSKRVKHQCRFRKENQENKLGPPAADLENIEAHSLVNAVHGIFRTIQGSRISPHIFMSRAAFFQPRTNGNNNNPGPALENGVVPTLDLGEDSSESDSSETSSSGDEEITFRSRQGRMNPPPGFTTYRAARRLLSSDEEEPNNVAGVGASLPIRPRGIRIDVGSELTGLRALIRRRVARQAARQARARFQPIRNHRMVTRSSTQRTRGVVV